MTGRAMMAKLHRMLRAAEAEQATHRKQYGGECLSGCETVQEICVLIEVIEALGGRA